MYRKIALIVIIAMIMNSLCIYVSAQSGAPEIKLSSSALSSINETVKISISNIQNPTHSTDWIGLYEENAVPGNTPSIWWTNLHTLGISNGVGTFTFDPASISADKKSRYTANKKYKFIIAYDGTYTAQVSASFSVASKISLSSYAPANPNETINITVNGAQNPSHSTDWIGLYEENVAPGGSTSPIWWEYLPALGITNGSGTFTFNPANISADKKSRYTSGKNYMFILAYDDSFTVQSSINFSLAPSVNLSANTVANTTQSISVSVKNVNNPVHSTDWIGLYEDDLTPGSGTGAIWWQYLPALGITNGSGTFTFNPANIPAESKSRYAAGKSYKFVLAYDDTYTVQASSRYEVGAPYQIWVPTNCEKILQDQQPPAQLNQVMKLEAARNEYEGGQLIVRSTNSAVTNGTASISNLVCGSSTIPSGNVKIFRQHYMNITEPTMTAQTGWYPDALVPLSGQYSTFNITKGKNQGLWFTVKVPKGTPAGVYTGTITITASGVASTIPVELTVWDFELTDESHGETAFATWSGKLINGHPNITAGSPEHDALLKNYYSFLLDYRITSTDLPLINSTDNNAFVQEAVTRLSDPRVTCYRIPYYDDTAKTTQLVQLLRQRGLLNKGFFYLGDRIDEPNEYQYPTIINYCNIIKGIDPNVRHLLTHEVCNELVGHVNTWCSIINCYNGDYPEFARERQQAGDHIWWYTCVNPKYPYPSYHIDDYMTGARVLSWMQKYHKVEGNLYWCTDVFDKYDYSTDRYVPRDIWGDPKAFPGANGDGYLVFPGYDFGINGPIPTLRLEAIRDGAEDYEYLWTLEQRMNQVASMLGIQQEFKAEDALKPYYDRLFTRIQEYTKYPADIQQVRKEVAEDIAGMAKDPAGLVVFGTPTAGTTQMTIYTQPNTIVKVNGTQLPAGQLVGNAQKTVTNVQTQVGLNQVNIQFEKNGVVKSFSKKLLVREQVATSTVPINYCESSADIAKFNAQNVTKSLSNAFHTQGSYSLKAIYSANIDWPGISLSTSNGGIPSADWSQYKTLEFDVYNSEPSKTATIYCKFLDAAGKTYDRTFFVVKANHTTHVSIPMKDIFFVNKSNMDGFSIWMYKMPEARTLYFDNFKFTR